MGISCTKYVGEWKSLMIKQNNELEKKKEVTRNKKAEKNTNKK